MPKPIQILYIPEDYREYPRQIVLYDNGTAVTRVRVDGVWRDWRAFDLPPQSSPLTDIENELIPRGFP